jgi:pimeloyl-ACP methyl ester carboxylesterase
VSQETPRSGQQGALGADLLALINALEIPRALLAGFDWGGRAACIVSALWPDRVTGLVSSGNGYNIQCLQTSQEPIAPEDEHRFWYQYYFHSQRGYNALCNDRMRLCRYLWQEWSPTWAFDDAIFESSATAFENPDFAKIVAHSYRHRFNLATGDPAYDHIEALLAQQPSISVPSIVLEGTDDGVDRPMSTDLDRPHFTGRYDKFLLQGAGHNIPQESPERYVDILKNLL